MNDNASNRCVIYQTNLLLLCGGIYRSYDKAFIPKNQETSSSLVQNGLHQIYLQIVTGHFAHTNHIVDLTRAFRVIYKAPLDQPQRILVATESIASWRCQPVLCSHGHKSWSLTSCINKLQITFRWTINFVSSTNWPIRCGQFVSQCMICYFLLIIVVISWKGIENKFFR